MNDIHIGSCLCQKVKFQIEGNFDGFFLCHCRYCQKDTGSAHAANLFSPSAKLTWLSGEANVRTYNIPDTRHVKSFCETCSSAMPSIQLNGTLLVVPVGSLDSEIPIKPTAHIYVSSKAEWTKDLEKVKMFEKYPS